MNPLDVLIDLAKKMERGSLPEIKASDPEHKEILDALKLAIKKLEDPTYPGYAQLHRTSSILRNTE